MSHTTAGGRGCRARQIRRRMKSCPLDPPPDEEEDASTGGDLLAGGRWGPAGADLLAGEAAGHLPVGTAAPFRAPPPLLTCSVRGEQGGG
jgi:hypothetical protein